VRMVLGLALLPLPLLLCAAGGPVRADDLFAETTIENQGRSVAAQLAELNGDGRVDLFVVALLGLPPEEQRIVRVHLQNAAGEIATKPSYEVALPDWSAVYDVADVRPESPGEELVLLRPDGVTLLSLADASGRSWHLAAPGPTSAGLANDERGFEPFPIVYHDFGPEPWLMVPQIGQLTALSPTGEVKAQLAVPRRANYLIVPISGLLALETDFQIFVDVPKLMLGDVDGDARIDVISATRHEMKVFLRREDGSYPFQPDRDIPLRMVTPRDHIRGSGGVASEAKDIDGDGRLDLLISHVQGSLGDATTRIYVYMNHDGGWNLASPDQTLTTEASFSSNALFDIDREREMELVRIEVNLSVLELVEVLLSRELDVSVSVHRFGASKGFDDKPWVKKKLELPFSFETFRFKGFIPVASQDMNGDGYLDFVSSGGGKKIEISLGGPKGPFAIKGGKQKMSTAGVIHFGDLNGDGLPDFVIFDPHNFNVPVRIGRNLGLLPGTASFLKPR
jgi:hypothetical protein